LQQFTINKNKSIIRLFISVGPANQDHRSIAKTRKTKQDVVPGCVRLHLLRR